MLSALIYIGGPDRRAPGFSPLSRSDYRGLRHFLTVPRLAGRGRGRQRGRLWRPWRRRTPVWRDNLDDLRRLGCRPRRFAGLCVSVAPVGCPKKPPRRRPRPGEGPAVGGVESGIENAAQRHRRAGRHDPRSSVRQRTGCNARYDRGRRQRARCFGMIDDLVRPVDARRPGQAPTAGVADAERSAFDSARTAERKSSPPRRPDSGRKGLIALGCQIDPLLPDSVVRAAHRSAPPCCSIWSASGCSDKRPNAARCGLSADSLTGGGRRNDIDVRLRSARHRERDVSPDAMRKAAKRSTPMI